VISWRLAIDGNHCAFMVTSIRDAYSSRFWRKSHRL